MRLIGKPNLTPQDRYVVVDLETTGLSIYHDRIVEIAAVKVIDRQVVSQFSSLINPGLPIPLDASRVNHITDQMIRSAPSIEDVLDGFFGMIEGEVLVGHNITYFDLPILDRAYTEHRGLKLANDYADTLVLAQRKLRQLRHFDLQSVAAHFGIADWNAHRALDDCLVNQQIYERLLADAREVIDSRTGEVVRQSDWKDKVVCLTGQFSSADREEVVKRLEALGAINKSGVSGKTDILIVGSLGDPRWKQGSYGSKIIRAKELQEQGVPIRIITEEDMLKLL